MIEVTLSAPRFSNKTAVHVKLAYQDYHWMRGDVLCCVGKGKGVPVHDMKAYGKAEV